MALLLVFVKRQRVSNNCIDVLMLDPADYATALKRAFRSEQTLKDLHAESQRKRHFQAQHHQQQQPKRPFTGPPRPPGQGQYLIF
ncbi:hypothetical protein F511_37524 [Dorcoceras hygrometricum]|uniref:Uncharacterized protein n=1 Tax=Dorcoceras hygrometricum TaxID=472368 RepID=A0A2Z7D079_9LAMI|nr:hypothetical protein F511_37524 [Dorcoceras hygrometricum]